MHTLTHREITFIIMSMNELSLLRLMQAFDPLFPIGAYTLSNGMETYVRMEKVRDRKTLEEFLHAYLSVLPYNETGFAAKAAQGYDITLLDSLCAASRSPFEIRTGSAKLCRRFIKTVEAAGSSPLLSLYGEKIRRGECCGCHCIAAGLYISDTGADIKTGLSMYSYSLLAAMVNHAVKLVPLSQLDGQSALWSAAENIPQAVVKAMDTDEDELGISGSGFDLRSMQHEGLYTRIYIS